MSTIEYVSTTSSLPTNVLSVCKMPESVDIAVMKDLVSKYMESRTEYYKEKKRSPYVEDEFSEWFTGQATKGIVIGGGSCAMDVKTAKGEGIDAMCVIMNKSQSNEKSLMQNFSESGNNLDKLFLEKKDEDALKLFTDGYFHKLNTCKTEKELTDLYILAFVSTTADVYLVCFKIDIAQIQHVRSGGFVGEGKAECKNIKVNHFVDSKHATVKLYKSKKRLELRLLPAILESEHAVKIYTMV